MAKMTSSTIATLKLYTLLFVKCKSGSEKVKAYIIQRRTLQESKWSDIATVNGRLNAEYICAFNISFL